MSGEFKWYYGTSSSECFGGYGTKLEAIESGGDEYEDVTAFIVFEAQGEVDENGDWCVCNVRNEETIEPIPQAICFDCNTNPVDVISWMCDTCKTKNNKNGITINDLFSQTPQH